ncbi:hypothetical protein [Aeromonas piscicola]|uniref:hypothetical protein n=1 Tax=Aeromonas piscicola TaxID=600645 RepID=UPI0021F823BE|nr:hypothetical protein [Aeromonas piscicola]MCW0507630.1 hypothetical protein [Aeromonas piscicola]
MITKNFYVASSVRGLFMMLVILLPQMPLAAQEPTRLFPILTNLQMADNFNCKSYTPKLTYTAMEIPESTWQHLSEYKYHAWQAHYHYDASNNPTRISYMQTLKDLDALNKAVFKTTTPSTGQVAVLTPPAHSGGCAPEGSPRECWGTYHSNMSGNQPVDTGFWGPNGTCYEIPSIPANCTLQVDKATLSFGTIAPNTYATVSTKMVASCTPSTTIQFLGGYYFDDDVSIDSSVVYYNQDYPMPTTMMVYSNFEAELKFKVKYKTPGVKQSALFVVWVID